MSSFEIFKVDDTGRHQLWMGGVWPTGFWNWLRWLWKGLCTMCIVLETNSSLAAVCVSPSQAVRTRNRTQMTNTSVIIEARFRFLGSWWWKMDNHHCWIYRVHIVSFFRSILSAILFYAWSVLGNIYRKSHYKLKTVVGKGPSSL